MHVKTNIPGTFIEGPVQLRVTAHGDLSQPAIIFIHGWIQTADCWWKQVDALADQGFFVICYDTPGLGWSGPEDPLTYPFSPAVFADSLQAVIGHYRLQKFVLVGWSGGAITIGNALLSYELPGLRGIVFVGSRPDFFEGLAAPTMQDVAALTGQLFSENAAVSHAAFLAFFNRLTNQPLPYPDWQRVFAYNAANFLRGLSPRMDIQAPDPQGHLFSKLLPALPLLVIQGQYDELRKPELSRDFVGRLPHATLLEYEQSGHSPHLEEPERFNDDIRAFAQRCLSASATL